MPSHKLTTHYRGAEIEVAFDTQGAATLRINGLARQTAELGAGNTVMLSSTVQTDYEWHEFIEGIVHAGSNAVEVTVLANKTEIARESFAQGALS